MKELYQRIKDLGYQLHMSKAARDFIVDKGWDAQFGARPLKRAIQKYVEDVLAEELIRSNIVPGDEIDLDYNPEKEDITVTIHKSPAKKNAGE